jgi:hypothetical protein
MAGVLANHCLQPIVQDKTFNPNEDHSRTHMGSTTFGNANPATMIGLAMLQDIKINRAGCGRVRVGGRT